MKIVSLQQARSEGLVHYFTGKPCKRGHIANRYTSIRKCVICSSEDYKTGRRNNPKRFNAYDRKYRQTHPEERRETHRRYRKANSDKRVAW